MIIVVTLVVVVEFGDLKCPVDGQACWAPRLVPVQHSTPGSRIIASDDSLDRWGMERSGDSAGLC